MISDDLDTELCLMSEDYAHAVLWGNVTPLIPVSFDKDLAHRAILSISFSGGMSSWPLASWTPVMTPRLALNWQVGQTSSLWWEM